MLLASGCATDRERAPGEPTTVVLWEFGGVPGLRAWVQQAVADFNAERSDIQIELEFRDWATQRESLISTTIVGDGPDIVRVHHKYSVEFGELGGLYALENFPDFPQVKERILDNVWELVEYDGKHYGLPVTMLPFVLAVNTDIMGRMGLEVPKTWDEMLALGPQNSRARASSLLPCPAASIWTRPIASCRCCTKRAGASLTRIGRPPPLTARPGKRRWSF